MGLQRGGGGGDVGNSKYPFTEPQQITEPQQNLAEKLWKELCNMTSDTKKYADDNDAFSNWLQGKDGLIVAATTNPSAEARTKARAALREKSGLPPLLSHP